MKKEFHHIGIPVTTPQPNEIYLPEVKVFITDATQSEHRVEFIRCEAGCPFPELMKKSAHVAYSVENIEAALSRRKVLYPTFAPFPGLRVAFIEDNGVPIEFLEFAKK